MWVINIGMAILRTPLPQAQRAGKPSLGKSSLSIDSVCRKYPP